MTVSKQLPVTHLTFPIRCVRCARPNQGFAHISIFQGLDLFVSAAGSILSIPLPVCTTCRNRRWKYEAARYALVPLLVFVPLIPGLMLSERLFDDVGPGLLGALVVSFIGLFWWRRFSERQFDQRSLGVAALKWKRTPDVVMLRFNDSSLAEEVEQLTAAQRDATLRSVENHLSDRTTSLPSGLNSQD